MLKPAKKMQAYVGKLLSKHHLAFDKQGAWLRIAPESKSLMPLDIERIAADFISVQHSYTQNGDTMRDPEIVFWVNPATGLWYPCEYRQDNLGIRQVPLLVEEGNLKVIMCQYKDLLSFVESTWVSNLKFQDYLEHPAVRIEEGEME
jgi:hypothetical protein